MNIDLDDKELMVLVQAMSLYNNRVKELEEELAQFRKKKEEEEEKRREQPQKFGTGMFCCFPDSLSKEKKPEPSPFYKDYSFCKNLRNKLKQQQMMLPAEQHKEDKEYDYATGTVLNEKFGYNMQKEPSKWVRCLSGQKYIG